MPTFSHRFTYAGLLLACALAGCRVGPDYRRPEVAVPAGYAQTMPTTAPATQSAQLSRWWTTFNDPLLTRLIEQSVQSSNDLRLASARLREARALRRVTAAEYYPTIDASGSYSRSRTSSNLFTIPSGAIPGLPSGAGGSAGSNPAAALQSLGFGQERDFWQAGFDATWELDVFGRVRRSVEAADANVAMAEEHRRDVLVMLLAEVARNYLELRGAQRELAIARQNLQAQRQSVDLTQTRFKAGRTGELDVRRAEAQVAATESTIPPLETSIRRSACRIAVLSGRHPASLWTELSEPAPTASAASLVIPPGLPSELLLRRPDIRAAERQLAAATARIGAAKADLFPRFSLTGNFGFQSSEFSSLGNWDSRSWSFGPGVTWPIFEGGRIRANIQVHDARQEQALIQYEQSILSALEEVENALTAYVQELRRRDVLARGVAANRRAVALANEQYTRGLADFLTVLDAQRALFLTEDQLAQSERALAVDLVAIYKALGGGWE